MNHKEYNGWWNYETWSVALLIDNEQVTHSTRKEMAQDAWDNATAGTYTWQTREAEAKTALADSLKEWVEAEMMPALDGADLQAQLLQGALSEVNWHEIAENWLDEVDKTEEAST